MTTGVYFGRRLSAERWFFSGLSIAMLAAVLLGFSRTFYLHAWFPTEPVPPEPFFIFHGVVFTLWFLLLVLQPSLVAAGRTDLHRALGRWGAILAVVMVFAGTYGALLAAHRAGGFVGPPIPPLLFLIIPLLDVWVFAVLVGLAIVRRADAPSHKRLMMIASISLLPAAIARWPFWLASERTPLLFYPIADLFILALVAWDLSTRRAIHPVTLWAGLALVITQFGRLGVMQTDAWQAFARWAVGLLG